MSTPMVVEISVLDKLTSHVVQMNNTLSGFTKNVETQFSSLTKGIAAFGGISIAGASALGFLKDIRQEAKYTEIATNKLTASLGFYSSALIDQASKLEATNYIHAENIMVAQARIGLYLKEENQIRQLTPVVLDYARAKGVTEVEAAEKLSLAFVRSQTSAKDGEIAISRLGIEYTKTGDRAKDLTNYVNALKDRFDGQSKAVVDSLDGWDKLGFRLTEIKRTLGEMIFGVSKNTEGYKRYQDALAGVIEHEANIKKIEAEKRTNTLDYHQQLQRLIEDQKTIAEWEKKQAEGKEKSSEEQRIKNEANALENLNKLREKYNDLSPEGKIKNLREEQKTLLSDLIGTPQQIEEQSKLIKKITDQKIKEISDNAKKKIKGIKISEEDIPWYANDKFLKEQYEKEQKDSSEHSAEVVSQLSGQLDKEDQLWIAQQDFRKSMSEKDKKRARDTAGEMVSNLQVIAEKHKEFTGAYKTAAIALTIFDTYKSAQAAFAGFNQAIPGPVGFSLGVAAAIAATGAGLARAQQIANQKFATGTRSAPGGYATVGEYGPERMYIPRGTQIYNNQETRNLDQRSITINLNHNGTLSETFYNEIRRGGQSDRLISLLSQKLAVA